MNKAVIDYMREMQRRSAEARWGGLSAKERSAAMKALRAKAKSKPKRKTHRNLTPPSAWQCGRGSCDSGRDTGRERSATALDAGKPAEPTSKRAGKRECPLASPNS